MSERTKLWIADKMKELMRKKSIEKIRITEICEAAGIERSTFYYHFKDKYTLVAWIFYYSAKDIDVTDLSTSATHLRQMKKDLQFYKRAFEDTSQNALWKYMLEFFVEENTAAVKNILDTNELDPMLLYCIRYYCYGAVGMAREWINLDSKVPAETFVKMTHSCMPQALRDIFASKLSA